MGIILNIFWKGCMMFLNNKWPTWETMGLYKSTVFSKIGLFRRYYINSVLETYFVEQLTFFMT